MRYYYEKVLKLMQTRGYEGVMFPGRPPSPPAHLLRPGFPWGGPPNLQQHCWGRLVGGSRCSFSSGASSGWSGEMGGAPAWGWS